MTKISRATRLVGLCIVVVACNDEAAKPQTPAAPVEAPREPATPATEPTPPTVEPAEPTPEDLDDPPAPGPSSEAAASAMAAYRLAIDAYNKGDKDGYREAFTDPLGCFYGKTDHPRGELWQARKSAFDEVGSAGLFIAELTSLRETEEEVVLLDRGAWWVMRSDEETATAKRAYMSSSSDPIVQGMHAKVISMRKVEGTWRIAAETGPKALACVGDVEMPELPAAHERCARENATCLKGCDATCEDCGACNGCNMCPGGCLADLATCVGAPEDWGYGY